MYAYYLRTAYLVYIYINMLYTLTLPTPPTLLKLCFALKQNIRIGPFLVSIQIQIFQKNPRPCQDLYPQLPWYQADVLPIELSRLG